MFKNRIKTVSFDCGGTLYYEAEEDYMVFHRILLKLGYRFESVKVKEALEDARVWWSKEKARTREVWNEKAWVRLLRKMVSNLAISDQDLAEQLRGHWLSEAGFRAYEDAEPTLKKLKDNGFKLITISNVSSSRNLATYLRKAGLLEYFEMLVASGDLGCEKPNAEIFRIASRLSNTPVENMLHVGDKYEEDYLGARAAGMNAILIDRRGMFGGEHCPKISSLTDLVDLL
ncbi:MAG: HAD family hydrolase [Candidatus Brockarchaeota archaeon]|nr:HAD family hydrolase [Candidatus Brockarchaeota archaeon]